MGKLLTLKPSDIQPSQDYLKEDTLQFILQCLTRDDKKKLPPTPIIRKDEANGYIAIDGHNLLAVYEILQYTCEVYLAESPHDFLPNPENNPAISARNQDLMDKFAFALLEAKRLNLSFRSLIANIKLSRE